MVGPRKDRLAGKRIRSLPSQPNLEAFDQKGTGNHIDYDL
jgi:hypothetical protein